MDSPLLFNPSTPEWIKFLFTAYIGFFLLASIPVFWLGRRQESWLVMGFGIIALAGSSFLAWLLFYTSEGLVSPGFTSGALFGGFWGEGMLIARPYLKKRTKGSAAASNKKSRKSWENLDAKKHNELIKFRANFYNVIATALIVTQLIPLMTNFVLAPEKTTFNWRMAIFSVVVVLFAAILHLWARGMFNRLKNE